MPYRTRRTASGTGSLFGVLVILAVLSTPPLRNAVQDIAATRMARFIECITPDPASPAPTVTVGG